MRSFWVQVGGCRQTERPLEGATQIGEDVAEQVRGDDDVEALGRRHEARRECIDVVWRERHVRILDRYLRDHLVPENCRILERVRLRGRGDAATSFTRT